MAYKQLNIQNPCSQKWEEMPLIDHGRHCNKCNHTIRDFSEMNNHELLEMLQSGKYSCGRFGKQQMGTLYFVNEKKQERKRYWASIAAAIVAGTLQVSIAYSQTPNNNPAIIPGSSLILKGDKTEPVKNDNQKSVTKSEKLSFRVVDSKTKHPLPYVQIELMGMTGTTDSLGRIDFEINYNENARTNFYAHLIVSNYEEERIKLSLKACLKKLNVLYMRKKENEENLLILGRWG